MNDFLVLCGTEAELTWLVLCVIISGSKRRVGRRQAESECEDLVGMKHLVATTDEVAWRSEFRTILD